MYLGMTNLGLNTAAGVLMGKNPEISDKMMILKRSLVILLFSTGIILAAFCTLNLFTKDWINLIGKIPINLKDETHSACVVLVVFYLLSLPFSLLSAVYTGFQKVFIENVFTSVLNIVNFLVLITVIFLKGNLINYSVLWGISLIVFNITKYLFFYFSIYRKLPNELNDKKQTNNSETEYKVIFSTGMRFFFIGIASTIVWSSDILVVSNFISIESVVPYFITFKLFSIIYGVIFQVNNSIMPLLGKEYGHNNIDWINKQYVSDTDWTWIKEGDDNLLKTTFNINLKNHLSFSLASTFSLSRFSFLAYSSFIASSFYCKTNSSLFLI
jgi:O-antigen/teichoic acid export membrane protein